MIKLSARGVRSLRELTMDLSSGGFVVGKNGAGKSTLATCLGALLTGDPKLGLTIGQRRELMVRDGEEMAQLRIEGGEGWAEITWPGAQLMANGAPPRASRVAVGLDRPARMKPDERAAAMIRLLNAEPSESDWRNAVSQLHAVRREDAERVWTNVLKQGWDGASTYASRKATEAKGAWQRTSGMPKWGAKLGESWVPEGYASFILDDPGPIEQQVAKARAARDDILAQGAVQKAERLSKEKLAYQEEPNFSLLKEQMDAAHAAFEKKQENVRGIEAAHAICPCPHCDRSIEIWPESDPGGPPLRKLRKTATVDRDTLNKWRAELDTLRHAARMANEAMIRAQALRGEIQEARDFLATLPAEDGDALERAERTLADVEATLLASRRAREARDLHREVVSYTLLAELTSPDGLRRRKLGESLDLWNGRLAVMCDVAGWPIVVMDDALAVRCGGRIFAALSESEQWRVDAIIALTAASVDGSALVVLDAADKLDTAGRNGLVALYGELSVRCLTLMTATPKVAGMLATVAPTWVLENGAAREVAS